MELKISPENWMEKELNIMVDESNNTMKMYDCTFTFKKDEKTGEITVYGDGWDDDYELCSGSQFDGIWYFESMGLSRQHENMYCAAAKVLANII